MHYIDDTEQDSDTGLWMRPVAPYMRVVPSNEVGLETTPTPIRVFNPKALVA